MAQYIALERLALNSGIVEKGQKFASDDVPGRQWRPIDKDAKAAVKARDAAAKAAAESAEAEDPRVAELEAANADLQAEVDRLTADLEAATAPAELQE